MLNFWENIARYPRFFFSSMLGLVLILTTPFQRLFRTKSGIIVFIAGLVFILGFVFLTLKHMLDL
uniref:Uncharacterized protein ycf33 n=1 Tax=Aureoumbra lagunensis TaxID=44058 RepID=C6KIX6_9STRA|nr:conserved hypothetical plastid protein Ycf33 [Aureoumbra lagunensis]ACS36932.1 conserved hypothetical plastid protein Ycf33 [Aureoumbra lagunensis]